ncbi:MAG: hypothetical protein KAG53_06920 [Endozoicomonadaceae bacterium]|nr:hypothetical protein [Endozoicomonadaceae bacterium]
MIKSSTNKFCYALADEEGISHAGERLYTMTNQDREMSPYYNAHLSNSVTRMSLNGCFHCPSRDVHCTICHRTINSAQARNYLCEPSKQTEKFHYSNTCCYMPQRDDKETENTSSSEVSTSITYEYPEHITLSARHETFSNWPYSHVQKPEGLAGAGFLYMDTSGTDLVYCFLCGGGLRAWKPLENPYEEHRTWFPSCAYNRSLDFFTAEKEYNLYCHLQKIYMTHDTTYLGVPMGKALLDHGYLPLHIISAMTALSVHGNVDHLNSKIIQSYIMNVIIPGEAVSKSQDQGAVGGSSGLVTQPENDNTSSYRQNLETKNARNPSEDSLLNQASGGESTSFHPKNSLALSEHIYPSLKIKTQPQTHPIHPEYTLLSARKESFVNWPSDKIAANYLAESGFWYIGLEDCVRCFFCGGGLREWEADNNPMVEHQKWYSDCAYIKDEENIQRVTNTQKSDNKTNVPSIYAHLLETPAAQAVSDMDHPPEQILWAIISLSKSRDVNSLSSQDILHEILDAEEKNVNLQTSNSDE